MYSNIFTVTAALAVTATAFDCNGPYFSFYNRRGPAMSSQRLDPALFPGQQSPHMHDFDGGNGLMVNTTYEDLQNSECTTARIKPDKSLYWRPSLYWNGNGTGLYPVPNNFLKIYYKFGDNGNTKAKGISEFPEDFGMIVGDPFRRSEDPKNEAGIDWTCIGDNYSRITAKGFPTGFTSCKEGLTTQLTFPACWNGQQLNPKNASAHMAYPSASGSGIEACPEGFRKARFPSIFIEFWWDVSAFDGQYGANDNPWVLAHGDPTGFGMHADFKNGWAKGVLAKATADEGYCNCGCGCGDDQMKVCFGAENVNSDNDIKTCAAKPAFADETGVVKKLPGCNPLQAGPQEAKAVSGPDCIAAPSSPGSANSASKISVSNPVASATSRIASAKAVKPTLAPAKLGSEDGNQSGNKEASSDCAAPVTVTVTPTVYVTAAAVTPNASCNASTIYETVHEVATVTVTPSSAPHFLMHKRSNRYHH